MFSVFKTFIVPLVLVMGAANYLMYLTTGKTMITDLISSAKSFNMPDVSSVADAVSSAIPDSVDEVASESKNDVYRWVDEDGTVHFGEAPPGSIEFESVSLDPEMNIIQSVEVEMAEKEAPKKVESPKDPLQFRGAKKLMDDAKDVQRLLDERYQNQLEY